MNECNLEKHLIAAFHSEKEFLQMFLLFAPVLWSKIWLVGGELKQMPVTVYIENDTEMLFILI